MVCLYFWPVQLLLTTDIPPPPKKKITKINQHKQKLWQYHNASVNTKYTCLCYSLIKVCWHNKCSVTRHTDKSKHSSYSASHSVSLSTNNIKAGTLTTNAYAWYPVVRIYLLHVNECYILLHTKHIMSHKIYTSQSTMQYFHTPLSSVKRLMTFIFCKTWGPTHQGTQTLTTRCNSTCSKLTQKIRWDLLNTALALLGTFSKNLSQPVHIQIFSAVFGTEWTRALVGVLSCQLFPCTVKKIERGKKKEYKVRFRTNSRM